MKKAIIYYDWVVESIGFGTSKTAYVQENIELKFKEDESITLKELKHRIKKNNFMHDKVVIKNIMWI